MINPHIIRSLDIINKWFDEIFEEQEAMKSDKCKEVIYKIL